MIASLCRYGTGCFLLYNTGREVLQGLTRKMIFLKRSIYENLLSVVFKETYLDFH